MQITKSTERKVEKSMIPFKEQVKEIPKNVGKFFTSGRKKTLIITASILVIAAAVGINWMLFGPKSSAIGTNAPKDEPKTETPGKTSDEKGGIDEKNEEGAASFFALAVIDRQKARDEALEVLQTVVKNPDSTEKEKSEAAASMARIASFIEAENNIETLVKSKGFEECVAVVSDDSVSVVVGTQDTLMVNELSQIKEIIYLQTGVDPSGMRISEKIVTNTPTDAGNDAQEALNP